MFLLRKSTTNLKGRSLHGPLPWLTKTLSSERQCLRKVFKLNIFLQENRNLWLLTMFYLFKLKKLQFCNYCWAIRTYSYTCNQALSFSVLADLSHMLYIEKQVHFVPVAEFAVTLLCCTLLTIIFWPCNWLHLYVTGTACMIVLCLYGRIHVCTFTNEDQGELLLPY